MAPDEMVSQGRSISSYAAMSKVLFLPNISKTVAIFDNINHVTKDYQFITSMPNFLHHPGMLA
jgi:hypothetical protein